MIIFERIELQSFGVDTIPPSLYSKFKMWVFILLKLQVFYLQESPNYVVSWLRLNHPVSTLDFKNLRGILRMEWEYTRSIAINQLTVSNKNKILTGFWVALFNEWFKKAIMLLILGDKYIQCLLTMSNYFSQLDLGGTIKILYIIWNY